MSRGTNTSARLIAIDVDRTLLTTDRRVLPAVAQALYVASAAGARIMLATARSPKGVAHVMEKLTLSGPTICFGGGWTGIVHSAVPFAADTVSDIRLSADDVRRAVALAEEYGVDLSWHSTEAWRIPQWNDAFRHDHDVTRESPELVPRYTDLAEMPHKLMFIGAHGQEAILKKIEAALAGTANAAFSHTRLLEVNAKGVTKGAALCELLKTLGIDRAEVVAIGDSDNDMPMFAAAGYRIAMGNAVPELKARANWVTSSNDDGGVADAIWHLQETGRLPMSAAT